MESSSSLIVTKVNEANAKADARSLNNFDFLRFLAATMVVFAHSYQLTGNGMEPFRVLTGSIDSGTFGVYVFFIISGYLICQSWDNTSSPGRFFWKRILRIFPGLIVVTLFTALVLGPALTKLPIIDYFINTQTYMFLFGSIFLYPMSFTKMTLPGVFVSNVVSKVNGSLWSIPYEFTMYILLAAFGIIRAIKRKTIMTLNFTVVVMIYAVITLSLIQIPHKVFLTLAIGLYLFFFAGVFYYVNRKSIKYDWKIAAALCIVWVLTFKTPLLQTATVICIPYMVLFLAHLPIPIVNHFGKYGDFSYGIYIYAFPIQQIIVQTLGTGIPIIAVFCLSMACTLPFAVLSWHLVESRALKMKNINMKVLDLRAHLARYTR